MAKSKEAAIRSAAAIPSVKAPPIVGIGASAGGLEAFTELLRALPTNTGMAFVLVQHLEPKHESVLTALLARATKMPVAEVREGMHVEPNHVYVIPANADLSLLDGLLHIVRRKAAAGRHLPIDYFLRSLAETQRPRAVGVILSGTASDGTAGIRDIKQEGGITFAQDPESARFDGMPRSAIATGCVDFVLSPERIAKELARIAHHPFVGLAPLNTIPHLPAQDEEWSRLFRLLRAATGVDFGFYKKSTVKRRVARRMAVCKSESLAAYLKTLGSNRTEVDALFEDLLILVTDFFRDSDVFVALQKNVFTQILKNKPPEEPIRIWVAGCSTGQEVYSIAISLLERLGDKASGKVIQIFGTDASEKAIEKARTGLYAEDEVKEVSHQRLQRFFKRANGNYQVNESLREMCVFARHDLIRDPPFSKIDLLSCRNVLIYFEPILQKRVLAAFHYALTNKGVLLLGKTESLGGHSELFTVLDRKLKFFEKNVAAYAPYNIVPPAYEHRATAKALQETLPIIDLEKAADQVVWERSAYAGLVVNDDLQILHFRGDTSPYLRPVPGKATLHLMRILRDEVMLEVRSALQKARRSGKTIRIEGLQIRLDQHVLTVSVEVRLLVPSGPERSFLILFEPVSSSEAAASEPVSRGGSAQNERGGREALRLRGELARSREYVQAIIRDQETTNEELKTANEEALSSMEELQSTNEELETAKEELQSSNEELVTLNEQLQNRNSELSQLSSDLGNVLSGVNIAILILGSDGRIRRFTPPAEKLLGLIPGDVGRPIDKLRIGFHVPDLGDLVSRVEKGEEAAREVQSESGRWFLLRIHPFRAVEDKIDGALMAFVDIHELKQHQDAIQRGKNFISAILDAAKDLLVVVLDRDGRIEHFNLRCQQLTGYSQDEVRGRRMWDFLLAPEEVESVKATFREVAAGASNQRENYWIAKDGHRLLISWSNSAAKSDGAVESVIATGVNVTERQEANLRAQQSEATVQAIMESEAHAIFACDKEGRIKLANATAGKMFGYSRDVLLGQPLEALLPERFRKRHIRLRKGWFARPSDRPMGIGLELAGLRKDGSEFPLEVHLSAIGVNEGTLGVAFVSDITERKKSEQALIEYSDQLASEVSALVRLREAGNRLWRSRDMRAGLQEMIDAGMALLGADMGNIQLLNPQKQVLEIVAQRGFGLEFLKHFREVSAADDSACGRSLRAKERTIIEDVEADDAFAPHGAAAAGAGYRAVQSTPLIGKEGEPIGMFSTHFRKPHRPSENELRRFDLYAHQAAEFIERVRAEEQLRRSEATIQALLQTAAQAVLAIDKGGRIVMANATAGKMFGYPRESLLGQSLEALLPERIRKRHVRHRESWFMQPRDRPMGIGLDLSGLRKDGSEFPIEVSLSLVAAEEGTLGVAFISDITERKNYERMLLEYQGQLRKLTGALLSAQESGNREVARELHDVFSQELAALSMEISYLKEKLETGGQIAEGLSELGKRIERLSVDVHSASRALHPAVLDELGLEAALQDECDSFEERSGISTQFTATNVSVRLPNEVALCLYRVAQESLRNVHKHSQSPHVEVRLECSRQGVTLCIEDAGDGFDLDAALRKGGLGLISMEERVRLAKGELTIQSSPGEGTVVTVFIPLGKKPTARKPT